MTKEDLVIKISPDTRDLFDLLKRELNSIYGEDLKTEEDVLLYLYSYYSAH